MAGGRGQTSRAVERPGTLRLRSKRSELLPKPPAGAPIGPRNVGTDAPGEGSRYALQSAGSVCEPPSGEAICRSSGASSARELRQTRGAPGARPQPAWLLPHRRGGQASLHGIPRSAGFTGGVSSADGTQPSTAGACERRTRRTHSRRPAVWETRSASHAARRKPASVASLDRSMDGLAGQPSILIRNGFR